MRGKKWKLYDFYGDQNERGSMWFPPLYPVKGDMAAVPREGNKREAGEKKVDLDSKDLDCIKQQDAQQLYVFKLSREAHSAKQAASWPTAAPLPSQAEEMSSQGRTPTQIGWLFFGNGSAQ